MQMIILWDVLRSCKCYLPLVLGIYVTIYLIIAGEILDRDVPAEEEFGQGQDPAYNWYEYADTVEQGDQEAEDGATDDAFDITDGMEVVRYNVGTEEDYQDIHEDAFNVVVNEINADDTWSYTDEVEPQTQEDEEYVTLDTLEGVAEEANVPVFPPVVRVARMGGELVLLCSTAAVLNTSTR